MPETKNFFTTGEVSEILDVSQGTVKNYCDNGKLVCVQTALTNYRRIPSESLIAFMKKNSLPIDKIDKKAKKKILIVEDNESFREFLIDLLNRTFPDAIIEVAVNGYEACIKTGTLIPDLLILDLNLPKMDGVEVCRSIRGVKKTRHTKIIVVSGYLNMENREKLLKFNISRFFEKPVSKNELINAVKQVCYRKRVKL